MKLFTSIAAAAAVIGTSFTAANPAQASGCYPSSATNVIMQVIRGGGSPQEAINAAAADGKINSQGCVTRVRGYMRGYEVLYKDVLNGMNW